MSDSGENFKEKTSYTAPSTLAMMDQTKKGLNSIGEILPQTNIPNGRLGFRVTANRGIDFLPLETENVSPSVLLQSPNMVANSSSQIVLPSVTRNGPPEKVKSSDGDHATMMILNNGLTHQQMGVDKDPEDHNIIDVLEVEPTSAERRKNEFSSMTRATRTKKDDDRVIIYMESEENNPDDGFLWRKYGQKVIRGNPNTRSYHKCTFVGCKVKKHVERGDNVNSLVVTYYGIHTHDAPVRRRKCYRRKNQSGSSVSEDPSNQTPQLGRSPSSYSASQVHSTFLEPHDMTQLCMMPSLPDNQNHGFMYQNDERKIDRVILDGA